MGASALLLGLVALPLSACGTSPSARAAAATTTTTLGPGAGMLRSDLVAYFDERGIASTEYLLKLAISTTDPTWAMFAIASVDDANAAIRGNEGLAHEAAPGIWGVVAFGMPDTVCQGNGVPAKVAAELALSCH